MKETDATFDFIRPVNVVEGMEEEITPGDKVAASFNRFLPGAIQLQNEIDIPKYTPNYNIGEGTAQEIFKSYNIPLSEQLDYKGSINDEHLISQLENNQKYKDADKIINSMGTAEQILFQLPVEALNVLNYVPFLNSAKLAYKGSKAGSVALQGAEIGLKTATASVASEYAVMKANTAYDEEGLIQTGIYGFGFGGLIGTGLAIPKVLRDATSDVQAKAAIIELSNLTTAPKAETSFINNLYTSTTNSSALSDNPLVRQEAIKSDTVGVTLKNEDGSNFVQSNDTAMDIKYTVNGYYNTFDRDLVQQAKEENIPMWEASESRGKEVASFNNRGNQRAKENVVAMGEEAQIASYTEQTGLAIKVDATGTPILPDDFYGVIINGAEKELAKLPEYKHPDNLKGHYDMMNKFKDKADSIELGGTAGRTAHFYNHFKMNHETFSRMGLVAAAKRLEEAMLNDTLNKHLIAKDPSVVDSIREKAMNIAKKVIENDVHNLYNSGGISRQAEGISALKHRGLQIDRTMIEDLYINDLQYVNHQYADRMAGKIAMKEGFGIGADSTGSISNVVSKKLDEISAMSVSLGMSSKAIQKDRDNLKAIYETVLGTRKFVENPDGYSHKISTHLRKGASALYSGGFVKLAIGELGASVMKNGLGNTMKNFIPAHKEMLSIIKKSSKDDPILRELINMGLGEQSISSQRMTRYDLHEITMNPSVAEEWLDKFSHWGRKYSGFNFVTSTSELISSRASMDDLAKASSGKISKGQMKKFNSLGLTAEDIDKVNYDMMQVENGVVTDWKLDKWKDQDLSKKVRRYMQRASRDTILRADGTRVHRALSNVNDPFTALFTQYLQFPAEAFERLTMLGYSESKSRWMVGTATSALIVGSVIELEDQAKVKLGIKEELFTPDELSLMVATKVGAFGLMPNIMNAGLNIAGKPNLGTEYRGSSLWGVMGGAGGSTLDKAYRAYNGVIKEGDMGRDEWEKVMKVTPLYRLPYWEMVWNGILHNTMDEE